MAVRDPDTYKGSEGCMPFDIIAKKLGISRMATICAYYTGIGKIMRIQNRQRLENIKDIIAELKELEYNRLVD